MRKKLPIGIEFFKEFSEEDFYYVDKTMFIADLLRNQGKVNLFTRPRRFGKSLNMNMLKCFFEIGTDPKLFDSLKISQEKELCETYMGKFPVMSVTLKGVDGLSYQSAYNALRYEIGDKASRFQFLKDSSKLSAEEREMYQQLIQVGDARDDSVFIMNENALTASLKTLSWLLSKHYGSKVILLIDEYDVPLDKAFQAGYYDEMVSLIRKLFHNALKTNDSLYFAVLTGCLRVSKESIFTGLNNLKIHTVTDKRYEEYFGFTETEVNEMLQFYGLEGHADAVRQWYDGYRFGNVSVYCPWDVINYCDALLASPDARPQNYWSNTSGNGMVRRLIGKADRQTKGEIERLIAGKSIRKPLHQELTYSGLDSSIDNLWSVLFTTGYLTQKGCSEEGEWELAIPNREIRDLFVTQIQEWFQDESRADAQRIEQFCTAFPNGDAAMAEEILNEYLWRSISIRDTAVRRERKESFYHGMLLGLLQYENNWAIESNAESGEGYSGLLIMTEQRTGVVIEIKYAADGNLEKGCEDALRQIEEKKYDAALRREGMKKILKYGIAFYKKNCRVALEALALEGSVFL